MRDGTLRSLCFACGLVIVGAGCGGEPAPPRACARIVLKRPDVPEEKRVSFGSPCVQDSDCRSGLCDRGICGDVYEMGNYGRECVPGPSPTKEQLAREQAELGKTFGPNRRDEWHLTPFGRNLCTGYLCLDGRCRSCQSDAECQWEGSAGPYCVHYHNWSGKRCSPAEEAGREGLSAPLQ